MVAQCCESSHSRLPSAVVTTMSIVPHLWFTLKKFHRCAFDTKNALARMIVSEVNYLRVHESLRGKKVITYTNFVLPRGLQMLQHMWTKEKIVLVRLLQVPEN